MLMVGRGQGKESKRTHLNGCIYFNLQTISVIPSFPPLPRVPSHLKDFASRCHHFQDNLLLGFCYHHHLHSDGLGELLPAEKEGRFPKKGYLPPSFCSAVPKLLSPLRGGKNHKSGQTSIFLVPVPSANLCSSIGLKFYTSSCDTRGNFPSKRVAIRAD